MKHGSFISILNRYSLWVYGYQLVAAGFEPCVHVFYTKLFCVIYGKQCKVFFRFSLSPVKLISFAVLAERFCPQNSINTQFEPIFLRCFTMFSMNVYIIRIHEIDVAVFSFIKKQRSFQLQLMLTVYIYMMGFSLTSNIP